MAKEAKTIKQKIFDIISDTKKEMVCEGFNQEQYDELNGLEKWIIEQMQASPAPTIQPKPMTGIAAVLSGQQEDINGVTGNGILE